MARAPSKNPMPPVTPPATTTPAAANVDYVRTELAQRIPQYNLIRDCVAGDKAVKARRQTYLPMPNAADTSKENVARYDAYLTRAVFYNVSERTLAGLVGQVFLVDPEIKVPKLLDAVVKDANGSGVPLVQLAQECEETVIQHGRAGLFVDYPTTNGPVSRQQQLDGSIRPTINLYQPDQIINWRTITVGGKIILSLVVLKEQHEIYDDGFAIEYEDQYRVLRLDKEGYYYQEIWRGHEGGMHRVDELTTQPKDARGERLQEIPFTFVGAVNNSSKVTAPPMYALCVLNIAHYRNSADYEESVFLTGQATPVLAGLTERWVSEVLKDRVELGSRAAIPLPEGATASLLQMEERSAAFEAMEHKERQMVALGAKLVEQKTVQRTATEADLDAAGEDSILTTITNNVSAAFKFSLEWAAIFQGATSIRQDAVTASDENDAIVFELNTEFDISTISPEELNHAINAWIKDAISFKEMRTILHKGGMASLTDEDALLEIRAARMDDMDNPESREDNPQPNERKQGGNLPGV